MKRQIKKMEIIGMVKDKYNSNHDVIVELTNSKKYVATFFTLKNIEYLMEFSEKISGERNNGSFFWASDMCIIKVIDEQLIRETIIFMIQEDYFDSVFHQIDA